MEYFKLLPTQGDRASYASLIHDSGAPIAESQFKKSYDYFRRRLRGEGDDGEKIEPKRILDIIEKRLMVVMINLSETDDPYLIFESLNFKGSPLEQSDLVRNYFLMRFSVTDQQGVYDGLWLPMQNRLGQNLTEFMRHFLGAEGEEVRKGDVYTAVRRLVTDSDSASVRILMTRMERHSEKRTMFALSHFELNRHFGDHESWNVSDIAARARGLFKIAVQLWPRPDISIVEVPVTADKGAPAAFHGDCVKLAQQHLDVHLSKVSQTRYESGEGRIRMTCAVPTPHNESGDVPYFWFALHRAQIDFL